MSWFRRKGKADDTNAADPAAPSTDRPARTRSPPTRSGPPGDRAADRGTSETETRRLLARSPGHLGGGRGRATDRPRCPAAARSTGHGAAARGGGEHPAGDRRDGRDGRLQPADAGLRRPPHPRGLGRRARRDRGAGDTSGRDRRRGPRSLRSGADRAHPGAHGRRTERSPSQPFRRRRRSALVPARRLRWAGRPRPGRGRPAWRTSCGRRWWCAAARRCHRATCCRCACPPAPRPRRRQRPTPRPRARARETVTGRGTARSTTSRRSSAVRRSPSGAERGPGYVGPPSGRVVPW